MTEDSRISEIRAVLDNCPSPGIGCQCPSRIRGIVERDSVPLHVEDTRAHLPADWRKQLHKVEHGAMDARATAKTIALIESWIEVQS
jgi:hypothetical protein